MRVGDSVSIDIEKWRKDAPNLFLGKIEKEVGVIKDIGKTSYKIQFPSQTASVPSKYVRLEQTRQQRDYAYGRGIEDQILSKLWSKVAHHLITWKTSSESEDWQGMDMRVVVPRPKLGIRVRRNVTYRDITVRVYLDKKTELKKRC
ncbi:MAG: hypothetical protein HC892_00310 [Saprospiraceae bacterium]|nr:hypothetical protein [Saprospiraceae bacterium]